jgi:hypothetical protein
LDLLQLSFSVGIPLDSKVSEIIIGFQEDENKRDLLPLRVDILRRYGGAQVKTEAEIKAEKKQLEIMAVELEFVDFKSNYYKVIFFNY